MEGKRTALLIYISVCMYGYINMPGVLGFENVRSSTSSLSPRHMRFHCNLFAISMRYLCVETLYTVSLSIQLSRL